MDGVRLGAHGPRIAREIGARYRAAADWTPLGNVRRVLLQLVSDMLIMTLGLFAGVVASLHRPCQPEQWAHVKAARQKLVAESALPFVTEAEAAPVSEPGFSDGLATA